MISNPSTQRLSTTLAAQVYHWRSYSCTYDLHEPLTQDEVIQDEATDRPPLLLIHPIGVGLSRRFWDRFCQEWYESGQTNPVYVPDLLGCGESDMPHAVYTPEDWADQLQDFMQIVIQKPVVLVVQGALLPVAIALVQRQAAANLIQGMILADPPAWPVMTQELPSWQPKLQWNLFDTPIGQGFYAYARRPAFLKSFSVRQLFADATAVDHDWLTMLEAGSKKPASRHAVFSFLAGFWRRNYELALTQISIPTLIVVGNKATSISRSGRGTSPEQRLCDYIRHLPRARGMQISGRNVLPYESAPAFAKAIAPFVAQQMV
jgi:pimeloyl-ACP methyl ester carboxylesterase